MSGKTILLLRGGGGEEHDISLMSSGFIGAELNAAGYENVITVTLGKDKVFRNQTEEEVYITLNKTLKSDTTEINIDFAIPCFHGFPGETGEIPALLELAKIPYLGCGPEASVKSFDKITTKMWLDKLHIPNTPYVFLSSCEGSCEGSPEASYLDEAQSFFKKHGDVFVKSSSQGSSVGCYQVKNETELKGAIDNAFGFSAAVLIEQTNYGRELEVAAFEYKGELHITKPGEILAPENGFYSYDEKYAKNSKTKTFVEAKGLSEDIINDIQAYAKSAFKQLHLKHLSRIDFFLSNENEIYLNEVNTFPGLTPISMFPKMMENSGLKFSDFLKDIIN